MSRTSKRLLFAFLISSACYAATHIWYQNVSSQLYKRLSQNPIAKLSGAVNEVQRKPIARVIWEEITKNEDLYPGEAIRTSSTSEARILFLDTGTEIELESDSLIVLEKNDDGIALDFLKGNLFVKSSGELGKANLKLKSGGNEINLKNADLSLSKSSDGNVDLEVFKGTAELKQNGKATTIDKDKSGTLSEKGLTEAKNRIQVLSPTPSHPVYIDPTTRQPVNFTWKKLEPGYKVYVERGKARTRLYRNQKISASGETGLIQVPIKTGKSFFRLVGIPSLEGKPQLTSKTFSVDINSLSPPVILQPSNGGLVVINKKNPQLQFQWVTRNPFDIMVVEIARDSGLREKVFTKTLDPKLDFADLDFKKDGEYFVRLTGYIDISGEMKPVSSPVQKFKLKIGVDLIPPKLKSPIKNQRLTFQQIKENGLFASWKPVPGIKNYHVTIQNSKKKKIVDRKTTTNPLRLLDFPPGTYRWSVASVSDDGKKSQFAPLQSFIVDEMPVIDWIGGNDLEEYKYWTQSPSLVTNWQRNVKGVTSWRVRHRSDQQPAVDSSWLSLTEPQLRTRLEADGVFIVDVEGLDREQKVIARARSKRFRVSQRKLLPAPEFSKKLPDILKADKGGNLNVEWNTVSGAKKYRLEVRSRDGRTLVKQKIVERNTASLQRMKPGDYQVTVKAIDRYQRAGDPAQAKEILVPKESAIKAPTIKSLKVQ